MTNSLTRRSLLTGAAGVASLGALAACTGSKSGSAASSGSKTITLMNWEALQGSPYPAVFEQFEKETGYKIEYQFSASGSDYWPKTRAVLGSNNPPDIMRIDDDFVAYYASTGKLSDLSSFISSSGMKETDYYPTVFNNAKQPDGSVVAWSLGMQPRVIYYNKTMFQQAGVPLPPTTWTSKNWTWDDFVAAARRLTVPGKRWGADLIDDSGYEMIYPVNNGGTGRWSKDGTKFALADPPDAAAVQWVADLTCKYQAQPPWSELQQNNRGQELFAAGQIGMIERVSSLIDYFRTNVKNFEWDIAPIPANKAQKSYGNQLVFAIPQAAANPAGAWKLLNYLTTKPGADVFAKQGSFVPSYKPSAQLITKQADPSKSPAHIGLLLDAADNSVVPGRIVNDEAAIELYRPALDPVRNCQQPAAQVLDGMRAQVESIIQGS